MVLNPQEEANALRLYREKRAFLDNHTRVEHAWDDEIPKLRKKIKDYCRELSKPLFPYFDTQFSSTRDEIKMLIKERGTSSNAPVTLDVQPSHPVGRLSVSYSVGDSEQETLEATLELKSATHGDSGTSFAYHWALNGALGEGWLDEEERLKNGQNLNSSELGKALVGVLLRFARRQEGEWEVIV